MLFDPLYHKLLIGSECITDKYDSDLDDKLSKHLYYSLLTSLFFSQQEEVGDNLTDVINDEINNE